MSTQALVCTGIVLAVMIGSSYTIGRVKDKAKKSHMDLARKLGEAEAALIEIQVREGAGRKIMESAYSDFQAIEQVLTSQVTTLRHTRTELELAMSLLRQDTDTRSQVAYNRVGRSAAALDTVMNSSMSLRDRIIAAMPQDTQT